MLLHGLLVGCSALAIMIYRHLFAHEPIRFEDLRRLIVVVPLGGAAAHGFAPTGCERCGAM